MRSLLCALAVWSGLILMTGSGPGCKKGSDSSRPAGSSAQPTSAPAPQKVGETLAGAEAVSVEALLQDPAAYEGKIVRVAGVVRDWCFHEHAWYGVVGLDGKSMVRVFTMPRFKVPDGSLGKHAVAEGKVEVVTIRPEDVPHYQKNHKFLAGADAGSNQPLKQPIVRAFGAELYAVNP
jgi:hypothetical protein